jgi:hypothetical protein
MTVKLGYLIADASQQIFNAQTGAYLAEAYGETHAALIYRQAMRSWTQRKANLEAERDNR